MFLHLFFWQLTLKWEKTRLNTMVLLHEASFKNVLCDSKADNVTDCFYFGIFMTTDTDDVHYLEMHSRSGRALSYNNELLLLNLLNWAFLWFWLFIPSIFDHFFVCKLLMLYTKLWIFDCSQYLVVFFYFWKSELKYSDTVHKHVHI